MSDQIVSIDVSEAQILKMTDTEKLNTLIKITFANHKEICRQGELLFGNGEKGLCEKVRDHAQQFVWMWIIISAVAGSIGTALLTHLNK